MPNQSIHKTLKLPLLMSLLIGATSLNGCVTKPKKYDAHTMAGFTDEVLRPDAISLALKKPLSLEQVRQRTLAFNSEYARSQAQLMTTLRNAGARGKSILPQIHANNYAKWRNNANASVGVKVDDLSDSMPTDFFTAQDQTIAISSFTASWDLLEIGLSGFKSNRNIINAYKTNEQNHYLCNRLMVDVENAYWRAVAFEQAEKKSAWLKNRIAFALSLSQQRADKDPDTKLQELMFQRELIDINRWYQSLYRSLVAAKPDLARLMNLPAGSEFTLQAKNLPADLGNLDKKTIKNLITDAYKNRPEIRQSLYQSDLTQLKNKEDLWRHLPAMRFFIGGNNNSNSFILNQNFVSAGANLSWDLLRLAQIGKTKRGGKISLAANKKETQILASVVMAQVMIAREQMHKLNYDLTLAWKALSVQGQITSDLQTDVSAGKKPETYLVKEELMRELAFIREQMTRAELHTAKARLSQSIGIIPQCQAPTTQSAMITFPQMATSSVEGN